jgi:mannose-6-phosphate isomerase-like protein (cupin superfamily)
LQAALPLVARPYVRHWFRVRDLALLLAVTGVLAGCRPTAGPTLVWEGAGAPLAQTATGAATRLPPVAPGTWRGAWGDSSDATFQLLASDRSEEPHVHRAHDLTVVLLRGGGTLIVEDRAYELRAGDVLHVMRGRMHHFHPDRGTSTVALAIFTPILRSKDYEAASDGADIKATPHD